MTLVALLPQIAAGAFNAELWNGLVGLAGESLPLGDSGSTVRFTLSSPPPTDAWLASLRLNGGAPAYLHVREFPFRQMFNVALDAADVAALPDGLRQALLDGMFATILAALPEPARAGTVVAAQGLASTFPEHAASQLQWFDVALVRADGSTISFDAGCDRATLLSMLGEGLAARAPAEGPLAERLALPAYATLGRVELSYGEFTQLEPDALVVLAERETGRLAVRVDTALYEFQQADEGWTCLGSHMAPHAARGASMDEPDDPTDAASEVPEAAEAAVPAVAETPEAVSVSGLKIALDFDIAQLSVPVGTLAQWQAGSVVDIGVPAIGDGLEVTIRAGGNVIGQGDLVRIDERLAVRITRLTLSP